MLFCVYSGGYNLSSAVNKVTGQAGMGLQQYNEPIRYQPPPPAPPKANSGWFVKVLIGCCSCSFIGGLALVIWLTNWIRSPEVADFLEMMPANEQHVGETLAWRTLVEFPTMLGYDCVLVAGNFDDDPDGELVIIDPSTGSRIVNLSGSSHKITGPKLEYLPQITAWDFDGDGIDELVCEKWDDQPSVCVFGLDGKLKHQFKDRKIKAASIVGDYDGDGSPELLLIENKSNESWLYTQGGEGALVTKTRAYGYPLFLADVDDDGLAEVVTLNNDSYWIYNYHQPPQLEYWNTFPEYSNPAWAFDLTGDGVAEFICPTFGFVDPTDTLVPFKYPTQPEYEYSSGPRDFSCVLFHEDAETIGQLVIAPTNYTSGHVYMFDQEGVVTYDQQMWPEPRALHVLEKDGQEHLVVVTHESIMVFP